MQTTQNTNTEIRTLADFTRLVISFFGVLVVLGLYQQVRLYISGVLDSLISKSLLLLIVHDLGFAALIALPLAFLFKALERRKPNLGIKVIRIVLFIVLIVEGISIEFYVRNFEILGSGFFEIYTSRTSYTEFITTLATIIPLCIIPFYFLYRVTSATYKIIGRMYPFTIILFSLFLATLYSDKKPVNENKTQHLLVHAVTNAFESNKYEGNEEFPLLKDYQPNEELQSYFELNEELPNLVFVIMEGIGSDFVGEEAAYKGFTPYLDALTKESLYWPNHLSNTGESHASLSSILGSLPFGEDGFTKASNRIHRNTIMGILKKNGYNTAFYFGGNSALNQWDKFLFEDRIDYMLDVKGFGTDYIKQKEDAAGISLGYPDKELFRKWYEGRSTLNMPYAEVFFTLSSKKPFRIPDRDKYVNEVTSRIDSRELPKSTYKIINRNKKAFASVLYADEALSQFMKAYKKLPAYENTIFIITGSHNMNELPQLNPLSRYRVPLIIYSPLLKKNSRVKDVVSHADIVPAILGLLNAKYQLDLPDKVSFLGTGLVNQQPIDPDKYIPLFRHSSNIVDFISGPHLISGGYAYKMNESMSLEENEEKAVLAQLKYDFNQFKAINKYVTRENKLIPGELALFVQTAREPNKQEMIWINSVFNGSNFDNAYKTARSLALDGDRERALLLCSYILNRVPGHADTEILMGRIHAWQGNYVQAIEILEGAILKYPVYADGYSALLDVYFWSDKNEKALMLERQIQRNRVNNDELQEKMYRAIQQMSKKKTGQTEKIRNLTNINEGSVTETHLE